MQHLHELTTKGQIRRLRSLLVGCLPQYGLGVSAIPCLGHLENTTFRLEPWQSRGRQRVLARVHGAGYHEPEEVASELAWLKALSEAGIPAPRAIPRLDGETVTIAQAGDLSRCVTLLTWVHGAFPRMEITVRQAKALGQLMGRLHEHAAAWTLPPGFVRRTWDAEGLFCGTGPTPREEIWVQLDHETNEVFAAVVDALRKADAALGRGPDAFGLLHGDLHPGNLVLSEEGLHPIDFDDCGFGWWLYDLAVVCSYQDHRPDYEAVRSALLAGYGKVRELPPRQLAFLPTFIAVRNATMALWEIEKAAFFPALRPGHKKRLASAKAHCEAFLNGNPQGAGERSEAIDRSERFPRKSEERSETTSSPPSLLPPHPWPPGVSTPRTSSSSVKSSKR